MDAELERGFRNPAGFADAGGSGCRDRGATSVVVRRVGYDEVSYETGDAADLASLREALRVEGECGHCMCLGTVSFSFSRNGEDDRIVTLHHGESLRWDPFFFDAPLVESDPILDWLSSRGMPEAHAEYDDDRKRQAEAVAADERWHAAMPAELESLWPSVLDMSVDRLQVVERMARSYPDPVQRARVLLTWFGQGEGPWSGVPAHEDLPAFCLLELPLDVLVAAARGEPQTASLREGAARLFAGWDFRKQRRKEARRLPADLKLVLLEHALTSPDSDKRSRAVRAFAAPRPD